LGLGLGQGLVLGSGSGLGLGSGFGGVDERGICTICGFHRGGLRGCGHGLAPCSHQRISASAPLPFPATVRALQLAVSLLSDVSLLYLLAPAGGGAHAAARGGGALSARLSALPAHFFQRGPFTPAQRAGALAVRACQYGAVGLATGAAGTASVHGLVALRQAADAGFCPPARVQAVGPTSAGGERAGWLGGCAGAASG
jgi:hypothetical protein